MILLRPQHDTLARGGVACAIAGDIQMERGGQVHCLGSETGVLHGVGGTEGGGHLAERSLAYCTGSSQGEPPRLL